ncbi:MAG: hypothetical protein WCO94_11955 [Verrucomicrobiota bacterium]
MEKSIMELVKNPAGREWLAVAIETTDREAFLSDNSVLLAKLAKNVKACGISAPESMKAAVSQLVAVRALGCRASAITEDFRPWTRAEKMKAIAAQNDGIRPKEVLEWVGRNPATEKADRKKIYTAQTSDSIGRRWANEADALPVYLRASIEFWTTSPDPRVPPLCLLSEGAIAEIFSSATLDGIGTDTIRQELHRAGLYRPKGKAFSYNGRKISARRRL